MAPSAHWQYTGCALRRDLWKQLEPKLGHRPHRLVVGKCIEYSANARVMVALTIAMDIMQRCVAHLQLCSRFDLLGRAFPGRG